MLMITQILGPVKPSGDTFNKKLLCLYAGRVCVCVLYDSYITVTLNNIYWYVLAIFIVFWEVRYSRLYPYLLTLQGVLKQRRPNIFQLIFFPAYFPAGLVISFVCKWKPKVQTYVHTCGILLWIIVCLPLGLNSHDFTVTLIVVYDSGCSVRS
jgi:hypothetical protein